MDLGQTGKKKFQEICKFGGVELNILVDYLTVSIKQMELDEIFKILKLDVSKMQKGYSRWLAGKYYLGGISVHYGDYITLEMSGSGCRLLESLYGNKLNWIDFIEQFLCLEGSHLARIDIACDDRPGAGGKPMLSMDTLFRHVNKKEHRYISLAKKCNYTDGDEQVIYFGSTQSDRRLRIYNKAVERGVEEHWIRAEFQLRNDTALSFYMRALECGSIGKAYQGMMYDFLRFTREKNLPDIQDHNQSRLTVTRWWKAFCGNAARIKGFYVGGLEYNMERLERYLSKNAGSSMKTLLACTGGDISKLVQFANESEFNKHQDFLVKTAPLVEKMNQDYGDKKDETQVDELEQRLWDEEASKNSETIISKLEEMDDRLYRFRIFKEKQKELGNEKLLNVYKE